MSQTTACHRKPTGSLGSLISRDSYAQAYFMAMPDYVAGALQQHAGDISTPEQLHQMADELLPSKGSL